jgi:hypothetical protein
MRSIIPAREDRRGRSEELLSDLGDERLEEVLWFLNATSQLPPMLPPMLSAEQSFFFLVHDDTDVSEGSVSFGESVDVWRQSRRRADSSVDCGEIDGSGTISKM